MELRRILMHPQTIRFYILIVLNGLALFFFAGCGRTSARPAPAVATASSPLPAAIVLPAIVPPAIVREITAATLPTLVMIEREASIEGNLPLLASLWAENGRIVDGRGTSEQEDDFIWDGRAAILDRYQLAVFPAPPPPLTSTESATLTVEGDRATLINQGDHWRFIQLEGRWWLQELAYSQP